MQPDPTALEQSLLVVPFLNTPDVISGLKAELPDYLVQVAATDPYS